MNAGVAWTYLEYLSPGLKWLPIESARARLTCIYRQRSQVLPLTIVSWGSTLRPIADAPVPARDSHNTFRNMNLVYRC
jgi:hypothetical protein